MDERIFPHWPQVLRRRFFEMAQPNFPQWPHLLDEIKLIIIRKLDSKSRRMLRSCSRKDKELVENFEFRGSLNFEFGFDKDTGRWWCAYHCLGRNRPVREGNIKSYFNTLEEAYDYTQKLIRTAGSISMLTLNLEVNWKIPLRFVGHKRICVSDMHLNFIGGEDKGTKFECYNFLFSQIDELAVDTARFTMQDFKNIDPRRNDDLFEFEGNSFFLSSFDFDGLISDEQLMGVRSYRSMLWNCSLITPAGFVRFIRKLILEEPSARKYDLEQIGPELQIYFFGEIWTEAMFEVHDHYSLTLEMNVHDSELRLSVHFFFQDDKALVEVWVFDPEEEDDVDNEGAMHPYVINFKTRQFQPTLSNFIWELHQGLPPGFFLMGFQDFEDIEDEDIEDIEDVEDVEDI